MRNLLFLGTIIYFISSCELRGVEDAQDGDSDSTKRDSSDLSVNVLDNNGRMLADSINEIGRAHV